jgi:DNA-directed RNA polymerase specialized sigma24 family protein
VTDSPVLSSAELLRLWEEAQRIAATSCAHTLALLRRGEGGFYEAEDFWQDLFLAFWDLARRWHASPPPHVPERLWALWRRRLRHGGYHILRQRPQRLWRGRERAVDLHDIEGEPHPTGEPAARPIVERGATITDPQRALEVYADEEEASDLLRTLSATSRQSLYLSAVAGLSSAETARCLQLVRAADVHLRVHRARNAMRRVRQARAMESQEDAQP